jgi:hypothetical protein
MRAQPHRSTQDAISEAASAHGSVAPAPIGGPSSLYPWLRSKLQSRCAQCDRRRCTAMQSRIQQRFAKCVAMCAAAWRTGTHGPNDSALGPDTPLEIFSTTYVPPGAYAVTVPLMSFAT